MDQFKAVFAEMLKMALQNPPTSGQQTLVAILSVISGAFVFLKVCEKFDLPNVGMGTGFIYSLIGGAVLVGSMAAAKIYLPQWRHSMGDTMFYTVVVLAASVVIFAPILNNFIHGKYLGTIVAWLLGVAMFMIAVTVLNTGFEWGRSGQRALNKGSEHNAQTKEMTR